MIEIIELDQFSFIPSVPVGQQIPRVTADALRPGGDLYKRYVAGGMRRPREPLFKKVDEATYVAPWSTTVFKVLPDGGVEFFRANWES